MSKYPDRAKSVPPSSVRGLANLPGENNCFLNVVLQALDQIPEFSTALLDALAGHLRGGCSGVDKDCVFCATASVFREANKRSASRGRALRSSLAVDASSEIERCTTFNVGGMSDATEVYEALLERLHTANRTGTVDTTDRDAACLRDHCWLHTLLGVCIAKCSACKKCGKEAPKRSYWSYVTYLPSSCLFRAELTDMEESRIKYLQAFQKTYCETSNCVDEVCGGGARVWDEVLSLPKVVSIGLVWNSVTAPKKDLSRIADLLFEKASLNHHPTFASLPPERAFADLVGIICYYKGCHYVSYFYHTGECVWVFIDDNVVKVVSDDVAGVSEHIKQGMYQPCLLFYRTGADPPTAQQIEAAQITEEILAKRAVVSVKADPLGYPVVPLSADDEATDNFVLHEALQKSLEESSPRYPSALKSALKTASPSPRHIIPPVKTKDLAEVKQEVEPKVPTSVPTSIPKLRTEEIRKREEAPTGDKYSQNRLFANVKGNVQSPRLSGARTARVPAGGYAGRYASTSSTAAVVASAAGGASPARGSTSYSWDVDREIAKMKESSLQRQRDEADAKMRAEEARRQRDREWEQREREREEEARRQREQREREARRQRDEDEVRRREIAALMKQREIDVATRRESRAGSVEYLARRGQHDLPREVYQPQAALPTAQPAQPYSFHAPLFTTPPPRHSPCMSFFEILSSRCTATIV